MATVLVDFEGNEVTIKDDSTIPAGTSGIILTGKDGTIARFIRVDANGQPIVVGAGTAGTPSGGVVSIQGVTGGQPLPITGTIEVDVVNTNASVEFDGYANPEKVTLVGGSDGINLRKIKVDTDGVIFVKVQEVQSTLLYDITDLVAYIGTAPVGSLSSQAVWTIKKTSFDINGNPVSQKTTTVGTAVWDSRVSELYN